MANGQYSVTADVIDEINKIDDSIVGLVEELQKYSDDDDSENIKAIYKKIAGMNSSKIKRRKSFVIRLGYIRSYYT